jgi:uncharacterized protein (DUF1330 family)
MPKGYLYADIVVTDQAEYEKYRQLAPGTLAAYGGRMLCAAVTRRSSKGKKPDIRTVVLEFESRERLLEWYNSPEYKPVREIRFRSATTNAVIMTGAE